MAGANRWIWQNCFLEDGQVSVVPASAAVSDGVACDVPPRDAELGPDALPRLSQSPVLPTRLIGGASWDTGCTWGFLTPPPTPSPRTWHLRIVIFNKHLGGFND